MPALGIEEGGIHSAEALALARYFMYTQVYFHAVRRIYDIHLKDFLGAWLEGARFSVEPASLLRLTDNEVSAAIERAAESAAAAGHDSALRIQSRGHFRVAYSWNPDDIRINPDAGQLVAEALGREFGQDAVRHDRVSASGGSHDFPVRMQDGRVVWALAVSDVLQNVPAAIIDYVFVDPHLRDGAGAWLRRNKQDVIKPRGDATDAAG